jgi:hypothetical protein
MKRNLFLFVFLIVSINLFAQEKEGKTYRIIQGNNNPDLLKYKSAFEKAHWDCYRTKSKPREIKFDNGITFQLFSVSEALVKGVQVPINCLTNPDKIISQPIYTLHESGIIMEAVQSYSSEKENKEAIQRKKQIK